MLCVQAPAEAIQCFSYLWHVQADAGEQQHLASKINGAPSLGVTFKVHNTCSKCPSSSQPQAALAGAYHLKTFLRPWNTLASASSKAL